MRATLLLMFLFATALDQLLAQEYDLSFGVNGLVRIGAPSSTDQYNAIVTQPDGKILAAGYTDQFGSILGLLTRFNADGSLDTPFGVNGSVIVDYLGWDVALAGVVVLSDGRVAVTGNASNFDYTVAFAGLYSSNGAADPTFGPDGISAMPFSVNTEGREIVEVDDGSLMMAGFYYDPNGSGVYDFMAAKYQLDGNLDPGFGVGGTAIFDNSNEWDQLTSMALQADGSVLVGGTTDLFAGVQRSIIVRFTPTGTIDATFNSGLGQWSASDTSSVTDIEVLSDGSFLAVTSVRQAMAKNALRVYKFNSDGTADTGFGTDGSTLFVDPGDQCHWPGTMSTDQQGNILVSGATDIGCTGEATLTLFALEPSGMPDPFFGTSGVAYAYFPSLVSFNESITPVSHTIDPNGRLLVAGACVDGGEVSAFVAAFHPLDLPVAEVTMQAFAIYPNPATDHFYLSGTHAVLPQDVRMVDATGRQVMAVAERTGDGLRFNVGTLASGCYAIHIKDDPTCPRITVQR